MHELLRDKFFALSRYSGLNPELPTDGCFLTGSKGDRNAYTRLGENPSVSSVLVLLLFSLSGFSELKS
jgi:hypothetical protein